MSDQIINVVIIGASQEAIAIIHALLAMPKFKLIAVVDENKETQALTIAKEAGVNVSLSLAEVVNLPDLNIIIEISGSGAFLKTLEKVVSKEVRIIDGVSFEMFLALSQERERLVRIENSYKLTKKYAQVIEESNRRLDDKLLELSLLNETAKTFSSAFDLNNIVIFIFTLLRKKINFDILALLLLEAGKPTLILSAEKEISPKVKEDILFRMLDRYTKYSDKIIEADKISIIDRKIYTQIKDTRIIDSLVKRIYTNSLAIMDKPFGMMAIASFEDQPVSVDDARFFDIVSSQVALFVDSDNAKQEITNERNRLEAILENMSGAVLFFDKDRNIISTNPGSDLLLGLKKEEILGRNLENITIQEAIKELFCNFQKQNTEFFTKELEIINQLDGNRRIFKVNLSKVHDYIGNLLGTLLIFYDITKEKEVDRMKTEFISITSHELRTPMATIKNCITLIFKETVGAINDNQRKFLDIAKRNIDRLSALINNLLDLSKMEAGRMDLDRANNNINDLVQEVIFTYEPLANERGLELKGQLQSNLPLISMDKNKITQVVNNLVSNAIKFTPERKVITIMTSIYQENRSFVQIKVVDQGVGISKDDIPKLFKKFQQLDSTMTRKVAGTGLGLAICKEIIQLHGGKIWVESELGKGSSFIFILPIMPSENKNKKKILIIDDEEDLCLRLKKILETQNFMVAFALSGDDGLAKAKEYKPDLIILDLIMPKLDGFEICRLLKASHETSSIPIIVFTGIDKDDAARRALALGAQGYLVKPFDHNTFLFTIKEVLGKIS